MANSPQVVKLGTFRFDELLFEVPENFEIKKRTLGGSTAIPAAPGVPAQVVTQTFGVIVEPFTLDAWFIGPNAQDNVRKMDAIQLQQNTIAFQFGARSFAVTVMMFGGKQSSTNEIGYTLELTPQVETSSASAGKSGTSAAASLSSNLSTIANYPSPPF